MRFVVLALALAFVPGHAHAHSTCEAERLLRGLTSQRYASALAGLPRMRFELRDFVDSAAPSPWIRAVLEHLTDPEVTVKNLTPAVRAEIGLHPRINALCAAYHVPLVGKELTSDSHSINDQIRLNPDSPWIERDRINLFVPDILPSRVRTQDKAWDIGRLFHELAHVHVHRHFERKIADLLTVIPPELLKRQGDKYAMHSQLYDYLHEIFAYRIGYGALLEYQAFVNPVLRSTRAVHKTPHGPMNLYMTGETLEREVERMVMAVYEIRDPRVVRLVQEGIFNRVMGL